VNSVRQVTTGFDADGRSRVVSDREVTRVVTRPTGLRVMELWGADAVPAADSALDGDISAEPPLGGISVRFVVFPPDAGVSAAGVGEDHDAEPSGQPAEGARSDRRPPGMHRTDTIDIATVVDGEIWLVLDDGETLLRAGDTLVQRATSHAWSNRSGRPCAMVSTMISSTTALVADTWVEPEN
jgi:hypothetical protein